MSRALAEAAVKAAAWRAVETLGHADAIKLLEEVKREIADSEWKRG